MYYLNDKHPKYQYGLYQYNGGIPYIIDLPIGYDVFNVYRRAEEIEKESHHYHRIFYIDNKFYKNEYDKNISKKYYKFLKRPIADWIDFDEEEVQEYEKLQERIRMAA